MRKAIVTCAAALLVAASTGASLADNINGTLGFTGKLGLIIPADSEAGNMVIDTDPGVILSGGVIYGFDSNAAFEMEVSHAMFDTEVGDATITDLAIGLQYRFTPENQLVPYLGAGFDVLMPDIDGTSIDTVMGAHVKGGFDYFLERNVALTAELKLTGGLDADISNGGGDFDPSSVVVTGGVRFYFR